MTPTTLIEIKCKCGTSMTYRRQLLFDNKNGVLRCHVCAEPYIVSDLLSVEKNGVADMEGKENGL